MNINRNRTALTRCAIAGAAALFLSAAATAEPAFRMQADEDAMFGVRALEQGRYATAAERSALMLEQAGTSRKLRAPALVNLCIAETMQGDYAAAGEACDAAVDNAWELGIALNNRGVLKAAAGDYAGAVRDFEAALTSGGSRAAAEHNLELARERVAALDSRRGDSVAAAPAAGDSAQGS